MPDSASAPISSSTSGGVRLKLLARRSNERHSDTRVGPSVAEFFAEAILWLHVVPATAGGDHSRRARRPGRVRFVADRRRQIALFPTAGAGAAGIDRGGV